MRVWTLFSCQILRTWSWRAADSVISYWCAYRLEVGAQTKLVLSILPFRALGGRNDEVVELLKLCTLLDVAGVARHGC
jgi:hypothetical protein